MSLQWHTKAKYMMSDALANSTGGVLITKKQWDQISPADQTIVRTVFSDNLKNLTDSTRKQNDEAITKFKQLGLKIQPMSQAGHEELVKVASQIRPQLVGKLYSADYLKKVEAMLEEFRSKKKGKK
jgi:TRAP-type C4-dicarboxylate transport system substrate-binding protein